MLDTPWLVLPMLMLVCLEAGQLLGRGSGGAGEELTVIQDLESVLVDQDHDAFAGMAQADLEPLAGDLDLAALADDAFDDDRPSGRLRRQTGDPGARQPVPQLGRDRGRQRLDHPAVADHLQQRRGDPDGDLAACPQQPDPELAAPMPSSPQPLITRSTSTTAAPCSAAAAAGAGPAGRAVGWPCSRASSSGL